MAYCDRNEFWPLIIAAYAPMLGAFAGYQTGWMDGASAYAMSVSGALGIVPAALVSEPAKRYAMAKTMSMRGGTRFVQGMQTAAYVATVGLTSYFGGMAADALTPDYLREGRDGKAVIIQSGRQPELPARRIRRHPVLAA